MAEGEVSAREQQRDEAGRSVEPDGRAVDAV